MKILIITVIFVLAASLAFATSYYVDSTKGDDINSGKTQQKAWQSIWRINKAVLLPGDSVLFKRGESFRGNLVPVSGTALGSITYGAYGIGNKPKLLGSVQKNAESDWVNEGENIWSTSEHKVVKGKELLHNPEFNSGLANWYEWHNASNDAYVTLACTKRKDEYSTSPAGGKLDCSNNGQALSDIQLWTGKYSIASAKWYQFSFMAKASTPFTIPPGKITIMQNGWPFSPYTSTSSGAVDITTSWTVYDLLYQSDVTASDARIDFFLGTIIPNGCTFYFDSFSLKELESEPGLISRDVGNIIFNNESFFGIKVKNKTDLTEQGKFWYDKDNGALKIYSVLNPASFYWDIEMALTRNIIDQNNRSYVTYENLDLRYGAAHGIGGGNTHHIWIKDLDISWIGGGYLSGYGDGKVRYGNGVEFWSAAHDNIVERSTFNQIYDAALTHQGDEASGYEAYNIYFRNNLINNSEYSFELWGRPAISSLHDIYFENNTCLNAGFGWGHAQRPDPNGTHLIFWGFVSKSKNIYIRNNIFCESADYGARYYHASELRKVTVDYNCWYESSGPVAMINNARYDFANHWKIFKAVSGQDKHSIAVNPLVNKDHTLTRNSLCIDTGIKTISVTEDFHRTERSHGEMMDMGAFEYILPIELQMPQSP